MDQFYERDILLNNRSYKGLSCLESEDYELDACPQYVPM
ncbi:hypothetical protein bthur0007_58160 [Bacillus thuringiensis serovar monterrey BGSC 4AJ1]|nr:hypothetical protein bthur0007_58160 [Bacillus thuringiensis serovar monterrey BGSC 4AJ1]